jgi:SAM-dependent methyltransferase
MGQLTEIFKEFYEFVQDPLLTIQAVEDQLEYGDDWERVVIGKNIPVRSSEAIRYQWARDTIPPFIELTYRNIRKEHPEMPFHKTSILDVGCGSGYGSRFFEPEKFEYDGIDINPKIIEYASENYASENFKFHCMPLDKALKSMGFDALLAFEIIEHLENGKELAKKLSAESYGFRLILLSVPYKEPIGYWGSHHKLHNLTENDFPDYIPVYLNMKTGKIQEDAPTIDPYNYSPFLMLLKSRVIKL